MHLSKAVTAGLESGGQCFSLHVFVRHLDSQVCLCGVEVFLISAWKLTQVVLFRLPDAVLFDPLCCFALHGEEHRRLVHIDGHTMLFQGCNSCTQVFETS